MNSAYGDTSRQSDNLHFLEEIDPSLGNARDHKLLF